MTRKRRRRSGDFSKSVVRMTLSIAVLFTIAILILFSRTGAEPQTLVTCFFAGVIAELWNLAGIKKRKIRHESRIDTEDERGVKG